MIEHELKAQPSRRHSLRGNVAPQKSKKQKLSDYGLTKEEVECLRKSGKDEWYHFKVLEPLRDPNLLQRGRAPGDRGFSFRNGPRYELSKVHWKPPSLPQTQDHAASNANAQLSGEDFEESEAIVRKMLAKDPSFSGAFKRVRMAKPAPKTPPVSKAEPASKTESASKAEPAPSAEPLPKTERAPKAEPAPMAAPLPTPERTPKAKPTLEARVTRVPPTPPKSDRRSSTSEPEDACCVGFGRHVGVLGAPFLYRPRILKRKPPPPPTWNPQPVKRSRSDSVLAVTRSIEDASDPTDWYELSPPVEPIRGAPIRRTYHTVRNGQFGGGGKSWLIESFVIRSYAATPDQDNFTERHSDGSVQAKFRCDPWTRTLSIHDATTGRLVYEAEADHVSLLYYQWRSQAIYFDQWQGARGKHTRTSAACLCMHDQDFPGLIKILEDMLEAENVRLEDSNKFWIAKRAETRGDKEYCKPPNPIPSPACTIGFFLQTFLQTPDSMTSDVRPETGRASMSIDSSERGTGTDPMTIDSREKETGSASMSIDSSERDQAESTSDRDDVSSTWSLFNEKSNSPVVYASEDEEDIAELVRGLFE